ncbi:hypothetical protein [Actinophytocola sp.]|uniref:hypothetical protein n=1 Tax=Actinophytocola sp. TaxID=1872138 RepID=UPI0025BF453F|nr:hypothetical protein [Actinophytocola sp.]
MFGASKRRVAAPDVELHALLAIADRGCELQDRAEAVLRGCAGPDRPDTDLAREGGYVAGEYHRLHGWAVDTPSPDAARVAQLLMGHCQLVHHAVRLAFPRSGHRTETHRRAISPDLGDPAGQLRARRDELARRIEG